MLPGRPPLPVRTTVGTDVMSIRETAELNQRDPAKALRYARRLIEFNTASHLSNKLIAQYLELKLVKHGFTVERLRYQDPAGVRKHCLVGRIGPDRPGGMAWFGHLDTVPAPQWHSSDHGPFDPVVLGDRLYGRGSCDMKGSIACFLAAAFSLPAELLREPLYVVLTADEETGFAGARCVVEESLYYRDMVTGGARAVIGEPTGLEVVYAHKGSMMLEIRSTGIAAHSSTAAGVSANWQMIPFMNEVLELRGETSRDGGWMNPDFDPPGLSINVCLKDNAPAINVTASESVCQVYLRSMPGVDVEPLVERLRQRAVALGLEFGVPRMAPPMRTPPESRFVRESLRLAGTSSPRTVAYGTDGAVLGDLENRIVCGPGSIAQAHTDDEWISLEQIRLGTALFKRMIRYWCGGNDGNGND